MIVESRVIDRQSDKTSKVDTGRAGICRKNDFKWEQLFE